MSFVKRFQDRVAIVTGAASGIGEAVARLFAQEGAKLTLVDKVAVDQSAYQPQFCQILKTNISEANAGQQIASATMQRFGRIDILVNIAGIGGAKGLLETDDHDLATMIEVNLTSVLRLTRDIVPYIRRPGGRVLNTSSTLGLAGQPNSGAYAVAKAGVAHFTRQLAADLGADGITVNAIAPGAILTPLTASRIANDANYNRAFIEACPARRAGQPSEVASAFAFLASDEASFISGQVLAVDGGWLAARHLNYSLTPK